jgi:MFS family permease
MKEEGTQSKAPLKEAFGQWKNGKIALIALFGLVAGQAVVWYSGQFYALFFINNVVKLDQFTSNVLVAWSLILGTAGFVFFGSLSDRIGRKPIILLGCALAVISYFTVFRMITETANPALAQAQANTVVTVSADPETCSFQFNPTGTAKFTSGCDIAKAMLAKSSVNYTSIDAAAGSPTVVQIGETQVPAYDGTLPAEELKAAKAAFDKSINDTLTAAGYPIDPKANTTVAKADHFFDIFNAQNFKLVLLMTYLIVLVTMVYGPMAAALVEMFPTRIRYSGMSLPYHIGNGWFGGLLPATAFAISAQSGNIYAGLWYAIVVAGLTVVIGLIFVPNNGHRRSLFEDDSEHKVHHSGYQNAPPSKGW